MFEDNTEEVIQERILDNVPDTLDKREGSVIQTAVGATAYEHAQMYIDMDLLLSETFPDTASYYNLIRRAAERGLLPREGTAAVLKVKAEPSDCILENGTEFNIGELNYTITEQISAEENTYALTCKTVGTEGNNTADDIIPMYDIDNLTSITAVGYISSGTDDEEEEDFRERYFESFSQTAFGGNIQDYHEKIIALSGVGGCVVFPVYDGPGTVRCVIQGADYGIPDASVVQDVQTAVDPNETGLGKGLAPIGHKVTVEAVSGKEITVAADVLLKSGYTLDGIQPEIKAAISEVLKETAETWGKDIQQKVIDAPNHVTASAPVTGLIVRSGRIELAMLGVSGIEDCRNLTINGATGNYTIAMNEIPVFGAFNGTVVSS
ncbi:uncharacterized homolog of phage Mu protein gp47 [Clostridium sp. SY8519]|uniref:baseplate J/gp47 family protein n=1 Tax=Clostridium sp. (strain SY8519) TaxID=1042156 RepID=UPI0002171F6B|nr:baseplate J/gp47 family protein [Clostridium sp. SY8519]BAK46132.1 uncharacterized homolog of phage Mu protein gp47 [Clostridium sp. SY8519]